MGVCDTMTAAQGKLKPAIAIVATAAALLAVGYWIIISPVTGVAVVDSSIAIGVVVVLFLLTGVWVFRRSSREGEPVNDA